MIVAVDIRNDGLNIPASRRTNCVYCSLTIDTAGDHVFQLAFGWVECRKGGGAHATQLMERRAKWACKPCIDLLRKGISPDQGTLFSLGLTDE
jgi:hypothetical protein